MNAIQADADINLPVRAMCRVLGVSHSGYYDWQRRGPSRRALANAVLTEQIRQLHKASDQTYGMPRVHAQLRHDGQCVSRKRVAALMREAGIRGVSRRRGFTVTTERNERQRPAPDLVNRRFAATAPNELWVADMTYIPTWAGFLYLAVVLDAFSRKVVGWAMGEEMTANLVLAALNMALHTRNPESVIHHWTREVSTRAWRSANGVARWACGPPWEPWATPTTTRWPRASSPRWSASCSIGAAGGPKPRRERRCSRGSKVGTTRGGCTPRWGTAHR